MFLSVIDYSYKNNNYSVSEEFDTISDAWGFADEISKSFSNETERGEKFKQSVQIISGNAFLTNRWNWTGYSMQKPGYFYDLCIISNADIKDFRNENFLLAAPTGPAKNADKTLKISLQPDWIQLPKVKRGQSFYYTEYYTSSSSNFSIGIRLKAVSKYFKLRYFNPKDINYGSLLNLFALSIPIAGHSLTFEDAIYHLMNDGKSNIVPILGAIKESDKEEYEKQYKNACIRIIEGFQSGEFKTNDNLVKDWIEGMSQLIESEENPCFIQ